VNPFQAVFGILLVAFGIGMVVAVFLWFCVLLAPVILGWLSLV
jgi:hypothetical protein